MGTAMTLAAATAVWDLCFYGVNWELEGSQVVRQEAGERATGTREIYEKPLVPPDVSAPSPRAPALCDVLAPVREVWRGGEPGGLVVILKTAGVPTGKEAALLDAMLRAVKWEGPVGFVGCETLSLRVHVPTGDALRTEAMAMAPVRLLLLGQDVVNHLSGKMLGVEAFGVSPTDVGTGLDPACVVATYPLDLLLARPLCKRLAWISLMRWVDGPVVTMTRQGV